jgi:hypothetical protein
MKFNNDNSIGSIENIANKFKFFFLKWSNKLLNE